MTTKLRFDLHSRHYRVLCNETMEEHIFSTRRECLAFAERGRKLLPDEPLSFTVFRVVEHAAEL